MTRINTVVRSFFYLWFSLVAGMLLLGIAGVVLAFSYGTSFSTLPMGGLPAWVIASGIILALLVFGQWEQFGRRVGLLKWIPLCLVTTVLGLVAFSMYSLGR